MFVRGLGAIAIARDDGCASCGAIVDAMKMDCQGAGWIGVVRRALVFVRRWVS